MPIAGLADCRRSVQSRISSTPPRRASHEPQLCVVVSRRPSSPAAVLSLPAVVSNRALDDWPQWRGPKRDGVSAERGLLKDWPSGGPKLAWKASGAGEGYSSFATRTAGSIRSARAAGPST